MSILNKPYEISVWDDVWNSEKGQFEERRLGIIGKHTMASLNRAMEPLFTRNVNGVKKLTFKMYKRYKDPVTGEQVENPFVDWLVSERKVKLYYEDKWHDFIVKNIVENSNNYLYTYQLEDALVQELSKNGFGIVLDTQLMNNMGTANELASKVLVETDWTVSDESEAFVQTIEDQLVYAVTTSAISACHVIDQTDRRRGVDVRLATIPAGKQVLVFYSSCVNKPYRFQFIYLDGKEIQKDSHRIILNKDCQYYIDVGAESNYTLKDSSADLYLPAGFNISSQTEDGVAGVKISGAYRGKRYGFTQQSKYVPTLDKYVNIYEKMGSDLPVNDVMGGDVDYEKTGNVHQSVMNDPWAGIFINGSTLGLQPGKTYELTYKFRIISGQVETIGGHSADFITKDFQVYGGDLLSTLGGQSYEYTSSIPYPDNGKFTIGTEYTVRGRFTLKDTFTDKKIWIQPNRGYTTNSSAPITFQVFDVTLKEVKEYYGYLHAEYASPALTQNIVSNTTFQSTSGWTGTRVNSSESTRAEVETVLGYFSGNTFVDSIDELASKSFDPVKKTYTPYLKITFNSANSRVINSGPYDNRVQLANIEAKDKWAMSYTCKSATGGDVTNLGVTLGEYTYDTGTLCHELSTSKITFSSFTTPGGSTHAISEVTNSTYSKEQFKKNSQVRICIAPPSGVTYPYTCYIENMELFKAIYNGSTLITPNEQGGDIEDRVIDKTYYYFTPDAAKDIENEEQLVVETKTKTLGYDTYIPVFNTDAQKIRSVTAKESNYFNILQSISETFEAWLVLDVERNDSANPGRITAKKVAFKNYVGDNNYAGFRYGVNLKDIQRTYESKNIVTKLIVKQNSNEHAENGFCTIARAGANPTGENYIYDFQYFHNRGLLNARDFLEEIYVTSGAVGPDLGNGTEYNLRGYYSRIKNLNKKIQDENDVLINIAKDITQYKADLEIAESGYEAAVSGIQEVQDSFKKLTNQDIDNITDSSINSRTDVRKLLQEYSTYVINERNYSADKTTINSNLEAAKARYDTKKAVVQAYLDQKAALNQKFFSQYSRFIQEGTWMSEEYVDDEKYYADALSVMYNSCYPQVAYSINVLELSKLPGYELFTFGLGDKTFAEDPEFFGDNLREEVIVAELSERLDDPSKNQIKVQNFKNQFQDLFQKITATVQQAQYNTGSYEKAVALAEAGQERKQQFLAEALDSASARLAAAGQQSVTWGNDGITVKSVNSPCDAIRMVGGAILLSKQDKNGEQKWVTGVTSDGISASLITAGVVNAGEISIMNYDEPVFRWDSYGISAYDATWEDVGGIPIISEVDSTKFVRFDKYGIYGMDGAGVDGASWRPSKVEDITQKATFALTWEGLKVTGNDGAVAQLGKQTHNTSDYIMVVKNKENKDTFRISVDGEVEIGGSLHIGDLDGDTIDTVIQEATEPLIEITESLQQQVDKKASIYYQSTDPADYTGNDAWGANNVGDMWRCTADMSSITSTKNNALTSRAMNSEWVWKNNAADGSYGWHEMEIPDNIFDAYDGKATLYTTIPNKMDDMYKENDLWIVEDDGVAVSRIEYSEDYQDTIFIATQDATTYSPGNWESFLGYANADQLIKEAINAAKAAGHSSLRLHRSPATVERWSPNPGSASDIYEGAIGDIVYYEATGYAPLRVYLRSPSTSTMGYWKAYLTSAIDISQELINLFTKNWNDALETSALYFSLPNSGYKKGQLWLPNSSDPNLPQSEQSRTYHKKGTLLTAVNDRDGNYKYTDWEEKIRYTDDTLAERLNDQIKNFQIQAGSIAIYNDALDGTAGSISWDDIIFLAGKDFDVTEQKWSDAKKVYLAGWTVTSNQLSYCDNGKELGQKGTFGIYPKGLTSGLHRDFTGTLVSSEDAWVMTAGNTFGLTKNGQVYATAGKIGGWNIGSVSINSIENGAQVYLYSKDQTTTTNVGTTSSKKWRIRVGNNFGVTSDGEVYANAGKIGTMEIGDLVGRANQVVGKNLLEKTKYTNITSIALNSISKYGFYQTAADSSIAAVEFGRIYGLSLEKGASYTLSFVAWLNTTGSVQQTFECDLYPDTLPQNSFSATTTPTRFSWTFTSTSNDLNDCSLRFFSDIKTNGSVVKYPIYITDIKLEKGTVATDWCEFEEAMQASVSNEFSWKFSPTEGMFMWNGQQPSNPTNKKTKDAILAIYDNREQGATTPKYELSLKGHIEAESGKIGEWNIFKKGVLGTSTKLLNADGSYTSDYYGIALDPRASELERGNRVFAIGKLPQDLSGTETWANAAFWVSAKGKVHCSDIEASGGTIGPLQIDSQGILKYVYNNTTKLEIRPNSSSIYIYDLKANNVVNNEHSCSNIPSNYASGSINCSGYWNSSTRMKTSTDWRHYFCIRGAEQDIFWIGSSGSDARGSVSSFTKYEAWSGWITYKIQSGLVTKDESLLFVNGILVGRYDGAIRDKIGDNGTYYGFGWLSGTNPG